MKYKLCREAGGTGVKVLLTFVDNGNERAITIERSQSVYDHSDDFEFGFGGSGPAQTALAILLDAVNNNSLAISLHQDFKWDFIAPLPHEGGEIFLGAILEWVAKHTHEY